MVGFKVFRMKSIGIILNPSARINRKKTANIIEELKDIFGGSAIVCPTSNKEEIPEVIKGFHKEGIKLLLISGGDGTICNVLTSYISLFGQDSQFLDPLIFLPFHPLPPQKPLRFEVAE